LTFIISDKIKNDGIGGICSMNYRNTKVWTEGFLLKPWRNRTLCRQRHLNRGATCTK